jgi:hypothetical protein
LSSNKLLGQIDIECGDDIYLFKSDFSFLATLNESHADPMTVYVDLANGKSDPLAIREIMLASIKSKNGKPVLKPKKEVEELITRYGLQECWILCRHLLAYAMVGDEKKSELRNMTPSKLTQIITEPFLLESSRNRRLLWVYHLAISGAYVCFSFSVYILLTALKII